MSAQGGDGGEGSHHAARVIHGVAQFYRRAVRVSGHVSEAPQGGEHGSVAGIPRFWPRLSVGGQRHHDNVGFDLTQLRISQPQTIHHAGTKILQHDIGDANQVVGKFQRPRFLEIERNRTLAGVDLLEGRRRFAVHGMGPPRNVQARRRFHLDDVGAQRRQDHTGEGAGGVNRKVGDANTGEGSGLVWHNHHPDIIYLPRRSDTAPDTPATTSVASPGCSGQPR